MKQLLLLLLLLTTGGVVAQNAPLERAISNKLEAYPAATLQDLYKEFFQDRFGPGHLIPDSTSAARYLKYELKLMNDSTYEHYERIGVTGRFVRVNLSVIRDGLISFDEFLDAFMRSATKFELPSIATWKEEWKEIETTMVRMGLADTLPHFAEESKAIKALLEEDKYVMHHSEAYSEAYKPHYRLIERSIFEKEILPKLP